MRALLDTHAIIWLLAAPDRLSTHAKAIIQDRTNQLHYSPLSFAEMAIKASIGKLTLADGWQVVFADLLASKDIEPLPLSWQDAAILQKLPFHHKDPFDRMLIASCMTHDLAIISTDAAIAHYDLPVIW